jgi:hypothetical protein
MPTETVVTIIAAGGFENSPSNIVSRHDARDQALPVDRMLRRRHGGQNRGHDDGSGMHTHRHRRARRHGRLMEGIFSNFTLSFD